MQIKDHLQFIGELGILGFKNLDCEDWIAKKDDVTVAFWGNSIQPWLGDIIVKKWNPKEVTFAYSNNELKDYDMALAKIKELLCIN